MAYRILADCIACGICINKCANGAVFVNDAEQYAIDPCRCTECIDVAKRRCHMICPVGAIQIDPSVHETPNVLWEKHRNNRRNR